MASQGTPATLERELDKHFELPAIRRVGIGRPFAWLALGWRDFRANLGESLAYGVVIAALGWLILSYTAGRPQAFTAAITGFFLIAPLLAAGLYEISRRQELGMSTSFGESLQGWRRSGGALAHFGVELVIVAIFWERLSAILFALFYGGEAPSLETFYRDIFLSGQYTLLVVAYVAIGAVFATIVFVLTAISIPWLLDRNGDIYTAMATSLIAVGRNILPMMLWAILIVAFVTLGFATLLFGLIVIFPVLGHATWHAYRDLTSSGPLLIAEPASV
jgi:uncharacterized membrane protein